MMVIVLYATPHEWEILHLMCNVEERRTLNELRFCFGQVAGRRIVLGLTGLGPERAEQVADYLFGEFGPKAVLALGFCTGLAGHLRVGDLIVPTSVMKEDGEAESLCSGLSEMTAQTAHAVLEEVPWGSSHSPCVRRGPLVSVRRAVKDESEAADLAKLGAMCCDNSLHDLAYSCNRVGLPLTALKVVTHVPSTGEMGPRYRIGRALATAASVQLAMGI